MANAAPATYIPWSWEVTPLNTTSHACPSSSSILGTYAAVNILTAALGLIFSHRFMTKKITFGMFGRAGSTSWKWMWLLQLGLHFGADLIVALLITRTSGYDHANAPRVWDLALFFTTRPRMAWIFLGFLGTTGTGGRREAVVAPTHSSQPETPSRTALPAANEEGYELTHTSARASGSLSDLSTTEADKAQTNLEPPRSKDQACDGPIDGYWTSAAKQTLITEAIMQLVGTYYLGRTAHFAASHGYYLPNRLHNHDARLMYAGALLFLVVAYVTFLGPFLGSPPISQTSRG